MATLTDAQLADLREKAKAAQSNRAALDVVRAINPKVADWLAAADPQTVLALIERLREAEAQIGEEVTPEAVADEEAAQVEQAFEQYETLVETLRVMAQGAVDCGAEDVTIDPPGFVSIVASFAGLLGDAKRLWDEHKAALAAGEMGEPGFWPESEVIETLGKDHQQGEPTDGELLDALEAELRTGHLRAGTHQWVLTDRTNPTIGRETFRAFARAIIAQRSGEPTTDAATGGKE